MVNLEHQKHGLAPIHFEPQRVVAEPQRAVAKPQRAVAEPRKPQAPAPVVQTVRI